jgi:hypothetical protein
LIGGAYQIPRLSHTHLGDFRLLWTASFGIVYDNQTRRR